MRTWELAFIPGLFQTPDYARAVAVGPGSWEDPREIEPFVEARLTRQARLRSENPLELWAVIHEGALRQLVGGRDVMRQQLGHLLDVAALDTVRIQVVSYLSGANADTIGAFSIVSSVSPGHWTSYTWTYLLLLSGWRAKRTPPGTGRTFDRIARVGLAKRNALDLIDTIRKEM
ncbi:DUF5753 domain-containing protein [Streptomyces sp. NPDC006385]|uniref:DUF5753 domain-containing protein n=1 Tax=Streptomyces sp. NPDC006385 TaxID=3156761 RepID=UPI0033B309DD